MTSPKRVSFKKQEHVHVFLIFTVQKRDLLHAGDHF